MTEYFYRYEDRRYSLGVDQFDNPLPGHHLEVHLLRYKVVKRTPKGVWVETYAFGRRFVLLTAHKKFACETVALAAESYRARKNRQVKILESQLMDAKLALMKLSQRLAIDATTHA